MKKLFALIALLSVAAQAAEVKDVKVKVLDGFGGDTSSVLARCQTKPGTTYDPVVVTRDVTSLKDSGEYQDITASAERADGGVVVTFSVFRKMRFQGPMVIKGNENFGVAKITSEAGLLDGTLYGEGELASAAEKVRTFYRRKGYPEASVTLTPKMMADGDSCALTLEIVEGPRVKIDKWRFEGVENVDPWDLRTEIGVYPWWNPLGWFKDEPSTPEELAQAVEKIAGVYADRGYLDVRVTGPVAEPGEDGKTDYVFTVDEGPLYTVGSVKVTGVKSYATADVVRLSDLPATGDVAGAKRLNDAAHSVDVAVGSGNLGLADNEVVVRRMPRADDPTVLDLEFAVTEGVPVVINQVVIEGNDFTKDKVIRREIRLGPGDGMLANKAEQSQKRLENLDYFSRVRYYLRETDKGKNAEGAEYRDLVYEVDEKSTGQFMVGIGASSIDSVYVYAAVQQSNFDLFAPEKLFRGGGQKGRLSVQAGPRVQTYEASVTEPWLFDRQLELTVEAYRRERWYDEYDIIRTGVAATLAYPAKFWNPARMWNKEAEKMVVFGSFGVRLSGEYIEFDDVESGTWLYNNRRVSFQQEEAEYGDAFEFAGRLFWTRDTRDNFRTPTSGARTQIFFDLAGGDNSYWRLGFNHRSYFKTWKRYNHVLMVALRAETIDALEDDVAIYNRLFLGGPRSIRGFEYRNVAPLARRVRGDGSLTNDYAPWGGQTLFVMNIEYTVPIVKMLRLAAFTDFGSVGEDDLDFDFSDTFAWSVGLGIRIDIPMFPIRLDFAAPLETPDHADEEVFSFSIGYDF